MNSRSLLGLAVGATWVLVRLRVCRRIMAASLPLLVLVPQSKPHLL